MPFTELAFEKVGMALEATAGVAEANPIYLLNMTGQLVPNIVKTDVPLHDGSYFGVGETRIARQWGTLPLTGPLDLNILPVFLNMGWVPFTSPTTPSGGTNTRQWTFTPTGNTLTHKTATFWTGDPNTLMWQGKYGILKTLTFGTDVNSDDATTMSADFVTNTPALDASVTWPSLLPTPGTHQGYLTVYLDTSSAVGTTALANTIISAEHVLSTGLEEKYVTMGTDRTYTAMGINPANRSLVTTFAAEVSANTLFNHYVNNTPVRMRFRHTGNLIEGTLYYEIDVDVTGVLRDFGVGTNRDTNRTHTYGLRAIKDATTGVDAVITVRNIRTSL